LPRVESRLMVAARAISQALLWLLATATCMFALDQLAREQLRAQLDGVASERLGMRLQSTSPHRWSGKVPTDIVAKRVFSTATFEFKDDGLHFRVGPGSCCCRIGDFRKHRPALAFDTDDRHRLQQPCTRQPSRSRITR
jgi:hypothetical protein